MVHLGLRLKRVGRLVAKPPKRRLETSRPAAARAIAAAAVLFVFLGVARSDEPARIDWRYDVKAAWKEARESRRPLLLYFAANDCFYCRQMERHTYADAGVADNIRQHFVAARVVAGRQPQFIRRMGVEVYPTTYIIAPTGLLDSVLGYVAPGEFTQRLQATQAKFQASQAGAAADESEG